MSLQPLPLDTFVHKETPVKTSSAGLSPAGQVSAIVRWSKFAEGSGRHYPCVQV